MHAYGGLGGLAHNPMEADEVDRGLNLLAIIAEYSLVNLSYIASLRSTCVLCRKRCRISNL